MNFIFRKYEEKIFDSYKLNDEMSIGAFAFLQIL